MDYTTVVILILWGVSLLVLLLLKIISIRRKKKRATQKTDTIFVGNGKSPQLHTRLYVMYGILSNVKFLHYYLDKLRVRYEILAPANERYAKENAMKNALVIWGIGIALLLVVMFTGPTMYLMMCAFAGIFIFGAQFIAKDLEKCELALMRSFLQFLAEVQQRFIEHGMVEEAIFDSIGKSGVLMHAHAEKLYTTLIADDQDEAIFKYNAAVPNQFLQQLLAICTTTIQYGDRKNEEGMSMFLLDMKALVYDVNEHLMNTELIIAKFQFLEIVAVLPVFALESVKHWALGLMDEFSLFYNGPAGVIVQAFLFIIMLYDYTKVVHFREPNKLDTSDHFVLRFIEKLAPVKQVLSQYEEKNYGKMLRLTAMLRRIGSKLTAKQQVLKQFLFAVIFFVLSILVMQYAAFTVRDNAVHGVYSVDSVSNGATEKEVMVMMMQIYTYTNLYKDVDWLAEYRAENNVQAMYYDDHVKSYVSEKILDCLKTQSIPISKKDAIYVVQQYNKTYSNSNMYTSALGKSGEVVLDESEADSKRVLNLLEEFITQTETPDGLKSEVLETVVAENVADKIASYRSSYFHWYFLFLAFIAAAVAFWYPKHDLVVREKDLQATMEDEVIKFMAVISILRNVKRMSIETILSWMGNFSNVFSDSIQKCINDYPRDNEAALEILHDSESHVKFRRLIEDLQKCDKINIQNAFGSIDTDRKMYQEQRKQDSAIRLSNYAYKAGRAASRTMSACVLLYMVIPFVWIAFQQLLEYMSNMNTF